jgi:hypothetical protein
MTKKEYIIKILDALTGYRPLARGIKILVNGDVLDTKTIDGITDLLSAAIEETKDLTLKNKLQTSSAVLEKLRKIETEQHSNDKTTLEELDQMIQNI